MGRTKPLGVCSVCPPHFCLSISGTDIQISRKEKLLKMHQNNQIFRLPNCQALCQTLLLPWCMGVQDLGWQSLQEWPEVLLFPGNTKVGFLSAATACFPPPSLPPVVHMETNTDMFKAFNLKYLLKSVWLGALNLPLLYRLYTKQQKSHYLEFCMWWKFQFFSHGAGLGFSVWSGNHFSTGSCTDGSWLHLQGTLRAWSAAAGPRPVGLGISSWSIPGVLLCLCPSDSLVIIHIIKNGRQVLLLFGSPAEDGCNFTSPSLCSSVTCSFSSSFHLHNQRAFSLCFNM